MSLTEAEIKLFGFQLGHFLQIKRFKEHLSAGRVVSKLSCYHQSDIIMTKFSWSKYFYCLLFLFSCLSGYWSL